MSKPSRSDIVDRNGGGKKIETEKENKWDWDLLKNKYPKRKETELVDGKKKKIKTVVKEDMVCRGGGIVFIYFNKIS